MGFPDDSAREESACKAGDTGDRGLILGLERSPGEGNGNPLQYSCPGESHGQRSLAGHGGLKESDMTELSTSLGQNPSVSYCSQDSNKTSIWFSFWSLISLIHD